LRNVVAVANMAPLGGKKAPLVHGIRAYIHTYMLHEEVSS